MSKRKKKKYQPPSWATTGSKKHWTGLYDDLVESPAFVALSPEAKILYFYIRKEDKGPYNERKGAVIFPYTHAVKWVGIRKGNIRRLLDELEAFGFIKIEQLGGMYRITNQYIFVAGWQAITAEEAKAIKLALVQANRKVKNPTINLNLKRRQTSTLKAGRDGKYIRGAAGGTT